MYKHYAHAFTCIDTDVYICDYTCLKCKRMCIHTCMHVCIQIKKNLGGGGGEGGGGGGYAYM